VIDLPVWYPDRDELKPAPMPLLLVQGFLITLDLEEDTDLLADPDRARSWLVEAGLLGGGASVEADELEFTREVREAIRSLVEPAVDVRLAPLRKLAAGHAARLTVGADAGVRLENARNESLGDGLFELLLIVHRAQQDGSWIRLKVCANPECQWAFFDRSRNQQGSWCSMAVCGNRLKNRELRARRRG
jgi:predicted RNA-binding Zn ribbon-like protein